MSKSHETLQHLNQFRGLIEATIQVEVLFRQRLKKDKHTNMEGLLIQSLSYQRFLERMMNDVFEDITL